MKRRKSGQALIELLVSLFGFFTITFMIVQLGFGFGVANYFHYATYMAARAMFASGRNEAEQKMWGIEAARSYLMKDNQEVFSSIAKGDGESNTDITGLFVGRTPRVQLGSQSSRRMAWEQGVRFRFKMKVNTLPIIQSASPALRGGLLLESESWLGRETSFEECVSYLDKRKSVVGTANAVLFDNGC